MPWSTLVIAGLLLTLVVVAIITARFRLRHAVLCEVLAHSPSPMLVYDSNGRLIFATPGLVLFDQADTRRVRRLANLGIEVSLDREVKGELIIDSNRYHYTAKPLILKKDRRVILIRLDYQGSIRMV